ncbi:MAG TPA: tetratricopeptide repeat-containing sensor histidine kinase [Flavipsychrobacter sp.]
MLAYGLLLLTLAGNVPRAIAGETTAIDSLKSELQQHTSEDTNRVNVLLYLSVRYHNISADSQRHYGREAYRIALKTGDKRYIVRAMNQVGAAQLFSGMYDSSIATYRAALRMCNEYDIPDLKEYIYTNIGNNYMRMGDNARGLIYFDSGAIFAEKNGNRVGLARIRNNIGSIYYDQGAYTLALKNYLKGLKLHEQLNNKADIEISLLNMSNVYYRLKDYPKAKDYIARAMKMAEESGSDYSVVSCLITLASIFNEEQKYDSAMMSLRKALPLAKSVNQPYVTNIVIGNMAEGYLKLGDVDSSYILYKETLTLSEQLEDVEGLALAKAGIGQILLKRGDSRGGIAYLQEALETLRASGMREQALETADILAGSYEKISDYKSALKYVRLKEAYRDTLNKEEALRSARNMEYDYQIDKREAQIALLEKDKDIEAAKLKQQRILLIAALAGLLLALIIAYLFFANLKRARKTNELILQQNREIEEQAKKLKELNSFKDTTFSVLSHDLRSPINALTGTMAMLDAGIITPEEFALHKQELDTKLQSVTLMLDNLLQWAKSQMKGENTLHIEKINVKRKVLKTFAVMKDAAQQKGISLSHNNIPDDLYVSADRHQLAMVMRNLLSNAIKFTPDNGTVTIAARRNNNRVEIDVTDTGIGMKPEQAARLFDGTPNTSTAGTVGEKGTGIGLHLSYDFIRNNGGDIKVDSRPGAGTTFTITLPAA